MMRIIQLHTPNAVVTGVDVKTAKEGYFRLPPEKPGSPLWIFGGPQNQK